MYVQVHVYVPKSGLLTMVWLNQHIHVHKYALHVFNCIDNWFCPYMYNVHSVSHYMWVHCIWVYVSECECMCEHSCVLINYHIHVWSWNNHTLCIFHRRKLVQITCTCNLHVHVHVIFTKSISLVFDLTLCIQWPTTLNTCKYM